MRLPRDPDNWTGAHAEEALRIARRRFSEYEAKVDFSWPKERIDDLWRTYSAAREQAVEVCTQTGWGEEEARALP